MTHVDEALVAMPASAAARLAGISERRLRSWEERQLVRPSVHRKLSPRNQVRLYNFTDLLEVLVVAELIDRRVPVRAITKLCSHIRGEYQRPLTEVRWATAGHRVYIQHRDGTWVGDRIPDQLVFWEMLDLEPLRGRIRNALHRGRRAEQHGSVVRRRRVMGSKPVFAGTRVPVEAVQAYLKRGHSTHRILEAYPQLTEADVELAREAMTAA